MGLDDPDYKHFRKHFAVGSVEWLGKVQRGVRYSEREHVNSSYVNFCTIKGVKVHSGYRRTFSNREAGFVSAAKYDRLQPDKLDLPLWELAGEWTKQHFGPFMSDSTILGKEDVLAAMDKSSSPGYPWTLLYHKKSAMLADERASGVLDAYWDLIGTENENRIMPIWTSSQKIEMRSLEKLRENALRTFTASPFEHSFATNRICLDQNHRMYASAGRTFSAVGISKFLGGWDYMIRTLERFPNAYELDEHAFDSSLFRAALFGQRDIRWSFLSTNLRTPVNWKRTCAIYECIVDSVMVLDNGELVQKDTGNPSGSSNTVNDNTMILFRLFAYAWLVLSKERGDPLSYYVFVSNVIAWLYGDDNTYSCSDWANEFFKPANISRVWTEIGVKTKTPDWNSRKVRDVSFLSQASVWSEEFGMYFPVPEAERVLSSLCFGSEIDDVRWHYLRACALRMDSYWNLECRVRISEYITYLERNHWGELVGVCNGISMEQIRACWKSDSWIEALYCGRESTLDDLPLDLSFLTGLC